MKYNVVVTLEVRDIEADNADEAVKQAYVSLEYGGVATASDWSADAYEAQE